MIFTEENLKKNVGQIIKSERKKRGLTQEKLAIEIGVEPKTLSKVETGAVFISASLLSKLTNYLKINPYEFFKFGNFTECKNDKDKLQAINQMLKFFDTKTLDIIYKMIKSVS